MGKKAVLPSKVAKGKSVKAKYVVGKKKPVPGKKKFQRVSVTNEGSVSNQKELIGIYRYLQKEENVALISSETLQKLKADLEQNLGDKFLEKN
mmetsp:Transcript_27350/g.31274  ORF Transcript_27350/g.31274 Transcript_27350/m.31274 type:complete len:93 (-) Transcript_27350:581-859(-)